VDSFCAFQILKELGMIPNGTFGWSLLQRADRRGASIGAVMFEGARTHVQAAVLGDGRGRV